MNYTETREFGGNLVSAVAFKPGVYTFNTDPYTYQHVMLEAGQSFPITLPSCTVFVRAASEDSAIQIDNHVLAKGDSAQLENSQATLTVTAGSATFLIAGVETSVFPDASCRITAAADQYKVTKPWGYELWLNGEHPAYVLKELFLWKGMRTSLQYHEIKRETVVMFEGTAGLVYKANPDMDNMDVLEEDLGSTELNPGAVLNTFPHTLHRMVALTDILYYEASTPHLDDVIRVHDDAGRGQGRIQSEHIKKVA